MIGIPKTHDFGYRSFYLTGFYHFFNIETYLFV